MRGSRTGGAYKSRVRDVDAVVIGAGFGGLAAALRLAERGARVAVCETLRYPGGCASTFARRGYRFEAGATLFSGLADDQLFGRWNRRWRLGVRFDRLDPVVELRAPGWSLAIPPERSVFVERFVALPGIERARAERFFETQQRVADALWPLFQDPNLLPPLSLEAVLRHLARAPAYLPVLRWMGRPLVAVARHFGLEDCAPLMAYLNAVSQITVQASASEAEAPFALAATDYFFRGTGHVHGGIGALAWALGRAIEHAGGTLALSNRVRALHREADAWRVETRRGGYRARHVIANVLPRTLEALVEPPLGGALRDVQASVEAGWGAAMLYLGVHPSAVATPHAHHLQLIGDPRAPLVEGNHVFCSVSASDELDRAPGRQRTVTVSTHVPMGKLRGLESSAHGAYIAGIQERMRATVRAHAPDLLDQAAFEMTASPRTFERFTGRDAGYVGGIPRTVGFRHYRPRALWPRRVAPGLYLVGDSVMLGQSTLAVALGGVRTADRIAQAA